MPFIDDVDQALAGRSEDDPFRIILAYMRREAVGRHNAKPWGYIEIELAQHNIYMSPNQFQQTILRETRGGTIFIGSTDQGAFRGYFLIADREDAEVAREFYIRRIAAQHTNLNHLDRLIERQWPNS